MKLFLLGVPVKIPLPHLFPWETWDVPFPHLFPMETTLEKMSFHDRAFCEVVRHMQTITTCL